MLPWTSSGSISFMGSAAPAPCLARVEAGDGYWHIWPIFSSSVMRPSRSATRSGTLRRESRYGGAFWAEAALAHATHTVRAVERRRDLRFTAERGVGLFQVLVPVPLPRSAMAIFWIAAVVSVANPTSGVSESPVRTSGFRLQPGCAGR